MDNRNENGEKLYFALNSLIDVSEKVQNEARSTMMMDQKHWIKEFCTVHAGSSRRAGHDYAIVKLLMNRFNSAIVISANMSLSKILETEYSQAMSGKEYIKSKNHVFGSYNGNFGSYADAIIVNNYSFMKQEHIEEMYELATMAVDKNKPFYVVLVH